MSLYLLILLGVLLIGDMASTLLFLKAGVKEGNPLVVWLMELFGPVGALAILKLGTFGIVWYIWKDGGFEGDMTLFLGLLNVFYAGVVYWNIYQLRLARSTQKQ